MDRQTAEEMRSNIEEREDMLRQKEDELKSREAEETTRQMTFGKVSQNPYLHNEIRLKIKYVVLVHSL